MTYWELDYVYYKVAESNKNFFEDSKLEITLNVASHGDILQHLWRFKLPNLRAIGILSISDQPEMVSTFLEKCMPDQVESFYIGGDTFLKPKLSTWIPLIIKNSWIKKELWVRSYK